MFSQKKQTWVWIWIDMVLRCKKLGKKYVTKKVTQIGCFLDTKALRLTWSSFQLVSQCFFNTIDFVNWTCQITYFLCFTFFLLLCVDGKFVSFGLKLVSSKYFKYFWLCDSTSKSISCQIPYFFWVSLLCVDGKIVLFWRYVKNRLTGFFAKSKRIIVVG